MSKDKVLFKTDDDKEITFEDLLKKIYQNSEIKQREIEKTVAHIAPMVASIQDAVTLLPYITDLQNASIKNDDALVKMAAIVSRGMGKQKGDKFDIEDVYGISPDERRRLIEEASKNNPMPGRSSD